MRIAILKILIKKKKARSKRIRLIKNDILCSNDGPVSGWLIIHNVDVGTVTFFCLEGYGSVREGVEGEVFAHAYVAARVEFGASLAYQDITCGGNLATE
jgi:hypothetical protein